jgi:2-polyprenyl-3-methyl-5-hydroxy-6-metoxy-1,4-benzoquinol methylase
MSKPEGYFSSLNHILLDLIPAEAGLVLDIGCGEGVLGAAFKQRHPDCRYVGVELDAEAAATARACLDEVIVGSVDDADLAPLAGQVDCIVYGDVLEHLVDPWAVVQKHVGLLRPGGAVAASIPNVQHWSVLQHLLRGLWTYADFGLLDRTHLRFFTLATAHEIFRKAGLDIVQTVGHLLDRPRAEKFAELAAPMIADLAVDPQVFLTQVSIYQYMILAVRK